MINNYEKQYVQKQISSLKLKDVSTPSEESMLNKNENELKCVLSLYKIKAFFQLKMLDLCDNEFSYLSQLTVNYNVS